MSDILSQDEIDRLLNAPGADSAPEIADLHPAEVETVEKLTKVFFASANSALTTLLARPASVSGGLGQVIDIGDADTTKAFLILFPFRSGFSGQLAFLMPHQDASILADLILGGEGNAKDSLDDADLDALQEAMTQVTGAGAPPLSATVGREIGFHPPEVREVEQGQLSEALPWGQAFVSGGTVKVDGAMEASLRILVSTDMAREMAQVFGDDEDEETPTQPLAAALPSPFEESPPGPAGDATSEVRNIDLILDIEVEVMVRLGQTEMPLKEIQRLRPGSIIDLDKDTEAPVDLVVNNKVIAKGELVVVSSDHFALRITDIETPTERIRTLGP